MDEMIKGIKFSDIDFITNLHLENLKDGLLYVLGKDILKIFYKEIFKDNDNFILAYYNNNKIVGVSASTKDATTLFNNIKKKYVLNLAFNILIKSLKKPTLPFRLIFSKHNSIIKSELLFLFVDGRFRDKKIGQKLVEATSKQFEKMKIKEYKITILSSNSKGKMFYERLGFKKIDEYRFLGEKRDVYRFRTKIK